MKPKPVINVRIETEEIELSKLKEVLVAIGGWMDDIMVQKEALLERVDDIDDAQVGVVMVVNNLSEAVARQTDAIIKLTDTMRVIGETMKSQNAVVVSLSNRANTTHELVRRLVNDPDASELAANKHCCGRCWSAWTKHEDTTTDEVFGSAIILTCRECGNKRCPQAANHEFKCTGSNAAGQTGVLKSEYVV